MGQDTVTQIDTTVWDDYRRIPQIDLLKVDAQGPRVMLIAGAQIKLAEP